MPSTSPGPATPPASNFAQVLPGAPAESIQSLTSFIFRFKRYVVYISGTQLDILSSPNTLVQAIRFKHGLVAIAAEEETGKIAIAGPKDVWVLQPLTEGWTKVWWERTLLLRREDAGDEARWLSWGSDGELLVGGDRALSLFSTIPSSVKGSPVIAPIDGETVEQKKVLWSKPVASAIRQAEFSPSAALIASCSRYDRLVKIWRRLSYEEGLFDHTYLPHSGAVTHLEWRPQVQNEEDRRASGVNGRHEEEPEVLYTIANDGILRIWCTGALHELGILSLHTTVDLIAAIPQSPSLTIKAQTQPAKAPRYVVMIPSNKFCAAVGAAIGIPQNDNTSHSKELLKEMVSKEPDVVVAFDGYGRMSAWGLQSIGHKRRPDTPTSNEAYHIAHAEGLPLRILGGGPAICRAWFQDDEFNLLVHTISDGGEVDWWQGSVETLFSSAAIGSEQLTLSAAWCGHESDVLNLQSSGDGLVSRSCNELTQWRISRSGAFKPRRSFGMGPDVLAAATISSGGLVLTLTTSSFALWDSTGQRLAKVSCKASKGGKFHVASTSQSTISGVFIEDDGSLLINWIAILPQAETPQQARLEAELVILKDQPSFKDVIFAVPVQMPLEPARSCVVAFDKSGRIICSLIPTGLPVGLDLEPYAIFETGVSKPIIFAANQDFASIASNDGSQLIVLNLTDGYVEHRQSSDRSISQLACFATEAGHNFLAIGHQTSIDVLAQSHYGHHSSNVPVWQPVRTLSISGMGVTISSMAWIINGNLAIAAGNTIILTSGDVSLGEVNEDVKEAFELGVRKNVSISLPAFAYLLHRPLPVWHPSLLSQLLQHGHPGLAVMLLRKLSKTLKFWSEGEDLHPTLEESPEDLIRDPEQYDFWLDDDTVSDLHEQLEDKDVPRTSQKEQQRLKHVVQALVYLRDHVSGLDRNALRYLFNWKLQLVAAADDQELQDGSTQPNGARTQQQFVPEMHWREICFAYQSTTQQPLLDILTLHHDNKITWPVAHRLGIMTWLTEREALEQVFEQLGQTAYRSEQPPDPVNATLFYLALHRKPMLIGLWRIATWHKEQRTIMSFLKRDFSQQDARTAAKKNAYALMGKRRFHYSAAFFLLADDPTSAASVLAGQCEDPLLAIAVARLYCGDGSPVLRKLLEDRILPQAEQDGDRWQMSWCHSVLQERSKAAEALIKPLSGVRTWHQDDPTSLLLYQQLRTSPSEHEYAATLRAARILRRMGQWLLALELVSKWEFKPVAAARPTSSTSTANGLANGVHDAPNSILQHSADSPKNPPSMLDSFADPEPLKPATAAVVNEHAAREAKAAELLAKLKAKKTTAAAGASSASTPPANEKKQPEPTQFKEPDPNSLLDSFGF